MTPPSPSVCLSVSHSFLSLCCVSRSCSPHLSYQYLCCAILSSPLSLYWEWGLHDTRWYDDRIGAHPLLSLTPSIYYTSICPDTVPHPLSPTNSLYLSLCLSLSPSVSLSPSRSLSLSLSLSPILDDEWLKSSIEWKWRIIKTESQMYFRILCN